MVEQDCLKRKFKIRDGIDTLKYRFNFRKEHQDYFDPDGLVIFVGPQGSGKTLSAVDYVYNLLSMYPKSILVTNINLKGYPIITFEDWLFSRVSMSDEYDLNTYIADNDLNQLRKDYKNINRVFPFNNADDLKSYENSEYGVIYLIDEIQLYFNSLESKNINPEVMTEISQQRKQRKHIVATSQVFGRMAKPLREQFNSVVSCHCYFNFFQVNKLLDRDSLDENSNDDMHLKGKVLKKFLWFHSPELYSRYDTYYKISRTKFITQENKKGDIYERANDVRIFNDSK